MAHDTSENLQAIAALADKIAFELAFAESGRDDVLLPVNCLLAQIEDLGPASPPSPGIDRAVQQARAWVNKAIETFGQFDEVRLKQLGKCLAWLQSACEAVGQGHPAPPEPERWEEQTAPAAKVEPAVKAGPAVEADQPLAVNLQRDGELLREFANESHEHLQNIEVGVIKLEEIPGDAETLNSIFRAFHTFKGGSGLLNLTPVYHLAHDLESLLDLLRQHKLAVGAEVIGIILEGGDLLKRFVTEIELQLGGQHPAVPVVIPTQDLLARVRVLAQSARGATPPAAAMDTKAGDAESSAAPAAPAVAPQPEVQTGAAVPANAAVAKMTSGTAVKVDTQKLDSLMDMVGEMVIAQSLVAQDGELRTLQNQQLMRNLAHLGRITNDLQRTAMSLRMIPIRATFQKMTRLVRDLANKQGKQVELAMSGEDTELDRTIVEEISDPLMHMVRNAVDHGIEKPAFREGQGKPPKGRLHLRAFHQGGNIVIEIKDDGAGLNRERIRQKAIEKGLIKESDPLDEKQVFNLIFAPGFSTAEVITEISGRGVGMDVVRRNIERLRGKIDIQSTPGQGSVFTIYLPLTLAIIDGLLVSVGTERYILPTLSVRESFRPTADMISTVHQRGEMVSVRGRLSPLLRLHDFFGVKPESDDPTRGIVVVIEADHTDRCLLVDRLIGKQEVVIKSLGMTFKQNPALAGATILGDGRVGLILDVNALVKLQRVELAQAA